VSRLLVTGAAGHLGSHLLPVVAESGWSVTALVATDTPPSDALRYADRVIEGNAADPEVARRSVSDADAVVHLAAIPAPGLAPAYVVFGQNSLATFCVLDAAAEAGVGRAVIASSIAAMGLSFSPYAAQPPYLPIDEDVPTQAADPYALSKLSDEATAAMISRRSGMTTTCLRLPFLGDPTRLADRTQRFAADPSKGRSELWSYLDTRDAAAAILAALAREAGGDVDDRSVGSSVGSSRVLLVAAPETLAPYPTEDLLDMYCADVPRRRRFAARNVPFDTSRAEREIGFVARHIWPVEGRPLPADFQPRAADFQLRASDFQPRKEN
jgi:nucleoside-diphosphate-sugar epimerase